MTRMLLLVVLLSGCQTVETTVSVEGGLKEKPRYKNNKYEKTSYRPDLNAKAEITFMR